MTREEEALLIRRVLDGDADAFEEIVLLDLRYYRSPVSELLAEEDFDRVLVLYNVGNFMTDSNLVRLS